MDYDGQPESLAGIEETIYAAAYQATSVPRPRVLTVGVGGGFDVLTALRFDASQITGVEINSATVRILRETYRDYFRGWVADPRVRLVSAEGRHFLTRSEERYDVLQLSGVDSYSGTPGAAHVFSESYLYTDEAFDLYLSRLSERGILNVMRLEHRPPCEMLRALTTAVAALRRAGVERPAQHIITLTATNGAFTALLVKRTPFTEEEEGRLLRWAQPTRFMRVSASPRTNTAPATVYQAFLALGDPRQERLFASRYPFDVLPVSDDRPFFFRFSRWEHVFAEREPALLPFLEYTLLALLAVVGAATVVCVGAPLLLFDAAALQVPKAARYGVFFGGIGLGYMAVELALLQKFGLFLGHPNYAVSVVLAALMLSSGLGALFSAQLVAAAHGMRFVTYALSAIILAEYLLVLPRLQAWIAWPFPARVLLVFGLVAPIGLALGTYFPSGFERLKSVAPRFAPWAWGLNGIFSVLGPILGVVISTTWGMNALLLTAIPTYLVAAMVLPEA